MTGFRSIGQVIQPQVDAGVRAGHHLMMRQHLIEAVEHADQGALGAELGEMLCLAIETVGAGPAGQAQFADMQYDAAWWADLACPRELETYVGAGLRAIERKTFAPAARKRLLVALWAAMDQDDRRAFLKRVDPEGQFVPRVA